VTTLTRAVGGPMPGGMTRSCSSIRMSVIFTTR
jgi:hypothetical protein